MPRGGRRSGTPGRAYPERTDLNTQRAPIAIPNQQRYGAQAEQLRAQQAVPTGRTPVPSTPSPGPAGPPSPVSAPATPIIPLGAPTMRPDEPVTAGVDVGPGPGAAPDPMANPQLPANLIVSLEMIATLPDASDATRNMVRLLRSRL